MRNLTVSMGAALLCGCVEVKVDELMEMPEPPKSVMYENVYMKVTCSDNLIPPVDVDADPRAVGKDLKVPPKKNDLYSLTAAQAMDLCERFLSSSPVIEGSTPTAGDGS